MQIELDPMRIGLRYPIDVGLVGDSRRTLQALIPLLERKDDRKFLETAQDGMQKWRAESGVAQVSYKLRDDTHYAVDAPGYRRAQGKLAELALACGPLRPQL